MEEILKQFDEKFGNYGMVSTMELGMLEEEVKFRLGIKDFLKSSITTVIAERDKKLVEKLEEKRIHNVDNPFKSPEGENWADFQATGYNQALSDAISIIKELK